jgi:hypothetical protein
MRPAAYVRVSTIDQIEGYSLDQQRRAGPRRASSPMRACPRSPMTWSVARPSQTR